MPPVLMLSVKYVSIGIPLTFKVLSTLGEERRRVLALAHNLPGSCVHNIRIPVLRIVKTKGNKMMVRNKTG